MRAQAGAVAAVGALAAASVNAAAPATVVDLSGDAWTLSNGQMGISVPAKLPSQAHLDLLDNQVIGDPYYGLNDFNLRWVGWSNWTYTSDGIKGLNRDNGTSTYLVFNGLDTFASVTMCGQHVGDTDNQFRQYYFDVSRLMSACGKGDPFVSIDFGSAPSISDEIAAKPGQETWATGIQNIFEFPNRWFIRKEQSDFGWDWGPAFAPAGPWQPAYVVQVPSNTTTNGTSVYARNVLVDVYRKGQLNNAIPDQKANWIVNASIDFIGSAPMGAQMSYALNDASGKTVSMGNLNNVNTTKSGTVSGAIELPSGMFDLWWPNGMGAQPLYNLTVTLKDGMGRQATQVNRRIGFRTIVLNGGTITPDQIAQGIAPGNNWHFEVNGQPFFAKGSSFVPADAFWPRVTREKIESLFTDVIDARMNMIRVWASGIYAPDFMYDIADEMGILLWSEFQFSDALYPVDQAFLDNVAQEVDYQTRRVNHHPSLAFWAGGNELEYLELVLAAEYDPKNLLKLVAEYQKLFLETIVPVLFGNSRSISYNPSSTSNGYSNLNYTKPPYFTERYQNTTPGSYYGGVEYYNYTVSVAFDAAAYPAGRFTSEFGFHSMPSSQTWAQAVAPSDMSFNSSVVTLRDHHLPPGGPSTTSYDTSNMGQAQMTEGVQYWYPTPEKTNPAANFTAWCHATQIFSADWVKAQIYWYRRASAMPQRTLGTLYWQLNDVWQAPSWSGIEYDGRWKALHYAGKDAYADVVASAFYNDTHDDFSVWVTSDLWTPLTANVTTAWFDWSGAPLQGVAGYNGTGVQVGAINSTQAYTTKLKDLLGATDRNNAVVRVTSTANATPRNGNGTQRMSFESWWAPQSLATARLVDPGLALSYDAKARQFTVAAQKGVAAHVWLDYPAGSVATFEANDFWLGKGEKRTVGFTPKSGMVVEDAEGWARGVTVQSLWNQTLKD